MTEKKYTKDDVRAAARGDVLSLKYNTTQMLTDWANRIEADERAVPVAWISHQRVIGIPDKDFYGALPVQSLQPNVYSHTPLFAHPPAQAVQVDRRIAIRLAQYGAEYAYRHKDWSIEPLQDGCEEHIDSWIAQAGCKCCNAPTTEPVAQGEAYLAGDAEEVAESLDDGAAIIRRLGVDSEITESMERAAAILHTAAQPREVPTALHRLLHGIATRLHAPSDLPPFEHVAWARGWNDCRKAMLAARCVTHHHACDCRERQHAQHVEQLQSRLAEARALLRDIADCAWFAREAPATVELIQAQLRVGDR